MADGGADAGDLVRRDGCADAAAADDEAALGGAGGDAAGDGLSEVGVVVGGVVRVGAEVEHLNVERGQPRP